MATIDLKDPEVQKAIKEAADAAVDEATEGLKAKNKELLGKLKKAQQDSVVDPAEHQALMQEKADLETKLGEANKALKKLESEAGNHKKAYETEQAYVQRLLVENGLSDVLLKSGVKPEFMTAVKAMLSSKVTIKVDGENRTAVVGDKSLGDFVTEWAKSDEGKHFVAATPNTGSGAPGGGTAVAGTKTMTRAANEALPPKERAQFFKYGGTLTQ
ncbi:MAG: hypothetical protein PHN75_07010 [Syntrophales bacterium]|nr:hypothetical protein [Syntrophales bacterium]